MRVRVRTILAVGILTAATAAFVPVMAQTTNATLVGTVTDPQGASIARATVTARNAATGVARQVLTDDTGAYRVYPLQAGSYDVTASMMGFQSEVASNVIVDIAANVKVDFALEVGAVTESVNVSANAAILQTQDATLGGTITTTQLENLPVNGRNFTGLVLLQPDSPA